MKILKKVLFLIVGIVALILVIALILPQQYSVHREIMVNLPSHDAFNYVKMLKNQDYYSAWASMDTDMKKEFRGMDGTIGFVSAWDSEDKDVGKGEQEIIMILEGKRIDYELRFFEPFEATDMAYITTESMGKNVTKVTWGFDGKMPYPMNLMLPFMKMEKMLGKDLQEGLGKLKEILEDK
jgi:Polyketide cyclase / dehydrase and lipid transport